MATNSFGTIFRCTTFGESHGKAIGVVIDGCPAGISLTEEDFWSDMARRAPGNNDLTSPRKEPDAPEILSGIFEGKTTGAPIAILIWNKDTDTSKYSPIKDLYRPGHANFPYLKKYGIFDWRGGGRASARETACRVAAGTVAKKLLNKWDIEIIAYMAAIAGIQANVHLPSITKEQIYRSPLFCPDEKTSQKMIEAIQEAKAAGDSVGGIVEVVVKNPTIGLGDPVYEKLEANLAKAMLSLPAAKGFEIGSGFEAANKRGSEHNDPFVKTENGVKTATNHAGGVLGGISTGMPIVCRVAFKPTSSIMKQQVTVDSSGKPTTFQLPEGSRHDPCVAIRAVPVVEAMTALVLTDALLLNKTCRLD